MFQISCFDTSIPSIHHETRQNQLVASVRVVRPVKDVCRSWQSAEEGYRRCDPAARSAVRVDNGQVHAPGGRLCPASWSVARPGLRYEMLTAGPKAQISHTTAKLSSSLEGSTVTLGGWLFSQRRASANLHFFTLRDSSGTVQLLSRSQDVSDRLMNLPLESVVQVTGVVQARKQKAKTQLAGVS